MVFSFKKVEPEIVDPKHISKTAKGFVNPFIGYKNIDTDERYATEGMCKIAFIYLTLSRYMA